MIQIDVEKKHIHAGLAKDAPLAAFGVFGDKFGDAIWSGTACPGYPCHLSFRRSRADVGIEPACGGSQEVGRDRAGVVGILSPELLDVGFHTVHQLLVGGPEIRSA